VRDLIALAKKKPGELLYASSGVGTTAHLAMEMFNTAAGVRMIHVPHKGADTAMMSLVSGDTQVTSIVLARVVPLAQAGRIRAIAVTGPRRSVLMPGVPTVKESGLPDYEFQLWGGLVAPKGTSPEIVQVLAEQMARILKQSDVKAIFVRDGGEELTMGPAEFGNLIKSDYVQWEKAIRQAGVRAE